VHGQPCDAGRDHAWVGTPRHSAPRCGLSRRGWQRAVIRIDRDSTGEYSARKRLEAINETRDHEL